MMNNRRMAEAIVRYWVAKIGPGFHPDNRADSYDPPLEAPAYLSLDEDMDLAFGIIGDDVYDITLEEHRILFGTQDSNLVDM